MTYSVNILCVMEKHVYSVVEREFYIGQLCLIGSIFEK